ncbi:MAG TPA: glycoside hydrolase family 130 protein [Polyangia bacterium]|nr:glycoside hydrolase family 130 protein [Polyangia bacterium]
MLRRTDHRLRPDPRRVIAKPYLPGEEISGDAGSRADLLMERILAVPEAEVSTVLQDTLARFGARHHRFEEILQRHYALVAHRVGSAAPSHARQLLIGAYFTNEYSVEGAALFNPSLVPAPDQTGLGPGERRFVMSLRAVGEGHISSIEFRTGVVDASSNLTFDPLGRQLVTGERAPPAGYDKAQFRTKLAELDAWNGIAWGVFDPLPDLFTLGELEQALALLERTGPPHAISYETIKIIRVLAASSYVTTFPGDSALSERVIFPAGPHETHGMEDARFVHFTEDDGRTTYYATYTAFDGYEIVPQLIQTDDFQSFRIATLNGPAAQNKGMALFPRPIKGQYVMLSRRDRENLHLATSTRVGHWADVTELHRPSRPWELLQIGNCGSPVETEAGWVVITHGVGPMRRYAIGALLLDLEDPRRVLGELRVPLLAPDETEREGYVPNVVYSCGGMTNGADLILPYGLSDGAVGVAIISLPALVAELLAGRGDRSLVDDERTQVLASGRVPELP